MILDRLGRFCLAAAALVGTTVVAGAQSGLDQGGASGGCTQFGVVMNCQGLGIRGGTPGSSAGSAPAIGTTGAGASASDDCSPGSADVMCMLSRTFGLSDDSGVSGAPSMTGTGSPRTWPPIAPQRGSAVPATGQLATPPSDTAGPAGTTQ
jgi:hypothetical protein